MRKLVTAAAVALIALGLSACGGGTKPLQTVADACSGSHVRLSSDAMTLTVDVDPNMNGIDDLLCVTDELGTSEAVLDKMLHTTALMGVVEVNENGFTYSFTYHPDNGLGFTVEDNGDGEIAASQGDEV